MSKYFPFLYRFISNSTSSKRSKPIFDLIIKAMRSIWYRLPLGHLGKSRLKDFLLKRLPFFNRIIKRPTLNSQIWQFHDSMDNKSNAYVTLSMDQPPNDLPIRLIAFYLPQFHPIPENNQWWGDGFTEWTNVKSAKPQFKDHYQPRHPGELGYYDLRDKSVQKRQIELAKLYGIHGFCFYFYWFAGKRLLEKPVLNYLEDSTLDLPFCLCWANENWSRRWDGFDNDILIAQNHSKNDDIAFIKYIAKYLRDPRYIRINGKPLLIIYRPSLIPSAKRSAKRWRAWCRKNGIGEIYIAYTQSFDKYNPRYFGFDAAIQFPPNNTNPPNITEQVPNIDPEYSGTIYDWNYYMETCLRHHPSRYTLFRGVNTSWDNTPRRNSNATIYRNSSPKKYMLWLSSAIQDTLTNHQNDDEKLIFINAWNEWAEGAYLEPDNKYGYAYLQATKEALDINCNAISSRKMLLIGHDAHPHGAQSLLLYLAKILATNLKYEIEIVLLGDGPLIDEYRKYATVNLLPQSKSYFDKKGNEILKQLTQRGFKNTIVNTTVSGHYVPILKRHGMKVVCLIHELPGIIKAYKLQNQVKTIAKLADKIVFPARQVREGFEQFAQLESKKAVIRPQGLFRKNPIRSSDSINKAKNDLRKRLSLPSDSKIVLNVAYADHRKGIDLFIEAAAILCRKMKNVYFVWVGHFDPILKDIIHSLVMKHKLSDNVIFTGMDFNTDIYYAGADIFAITSREDPFPSVVMEAMDSRLPVVAYENAGGFCNLVKKAGGTLVPPFDVSAYAKSLLLFCGDPQNRNKVGLSGKEIIKNEYSFRKYAFDLASMNDDDMRKVSVIVPNYNYARYLIERITSISQQTYPIWELIILDDASTDNSLEILDTIVRNVDIDYRISKNETNSGNVFNQWLKGVQLATGDYIWIAEADDSAESEFVDRVMAAFKDNEVVMSYCESKQIGSNGELLSPNYNEYVADISREKWLQGYIAAGIDEITNSLSIKNTIPNVSGVIFRKKTLKSVLQKYIDEIKSYKIAGDWLTYIYVLSEGKLSFSSQALNLHRRHHSSVTISSFDISQLDEIVKVQHKVRTIYTIEEQRVEMAKVYSQKLYEQFGLASKEIPLLHDHPDFQKYIEEVA